MNFWALFSKKHHKDQLKTSIVSNRKWVFDGFWKTHFKKLDFSKILKCPYSIQLFEWALYKLSSYLKSTLKIPTPLSSERGTTIYDRMIPDLRKGYDNDLH